MDRAPESDTEVPRYAGVARTCAVALIGAAVVALPTAYRTARSGGSALDGFVMATAVLLTLLLPLSWLKDKAARGFRAVVGPRVPQALGVGLGLWVSLGSLGLFGLAALLKANTHHRGLGGATFGVFGVGWLVVAAVMAARLVSFGQALLKSETSAAMIRGAAALLMAMPVGLMLAALALADDTGSVLGALFDLALVWLLVLALMWRPLPDAVLRVARYVALPLTVVVLLVGWVRVERSASVTAVKQGGGLVSSMLSAMELWSDRDGDGRGAHFGGGDCDEGDPRRYPGAPETAGDGIDSDCDGNDPPAALANVVIGSEPAPRAPATATSAVPDATGTAAAAPPPTADDPSLPARLLDKPDIILVTLDTVRADHTSVYGYEKNTTPNLKAFAKDAVVFEHCYAIGSSTQRALMPLVSGLSLSETSRSRREWPRLKEDADTVAERLKRAGYTTGAISSFTWLRKDRGFHQGFDEFDERPFREHHPERKSTGELAIDSAIAMYDKLSTGKKPLYMWLHMFDAHSLYLRHKDFDFGRGDVGAYDSELGYLDHHLGRFIDKLKANQRAKRTIWIVHGSHGEGFGEHDRKGHGVYLFEETIHVPLIIKVPGGRAGGYGQQAVSTLDIAATVLDFADAPRTSVSGVTLRAQAQGVLDHGHAPVWSYARSRTVVIDWPWKLSVLKRPRGKDRLLLFDLSKDPKETHDLSADNGDQLKRMAKLYRSGG